MRRLVFAAASLLVLSASAGPVNAQAVKELRIATQYGIGYLTLMVVEDKKLIEKHARAQGLGEIKVSWTRIGSGAQMNEALLKGDLHVASGGLAPLLGIWSSTRGKENVKGIAALNTMPLYLNTRNPKIKRIEDFTAEDRIALPAVKSSIQAVTLQMAAAQAFGDKNYDKLDAITVSMPHPEAQKALLSGDSPVTAHFSSPPYQYQQLTHPAVHTVTTSYDVLVGASSFNLLWTTERFHDQNPALYRALMLALDEATTFIKYDKEDAARLYLRVGKEQSALQDILGMLSDVYIQFTMMPKNTFRYSRFMYKTGAIKNQPQDWKDLFFSDPQVAVGS